MNTVYMKLNGRPYDLIHDGTKTVEVRLYDEKRRALAPGDLIIFQKRPYLHEMMYKRVGDVKTFPTFGELYEAYDNRTLGCEEGGTADDFVKGMARIYKNEDAARYGVCAVELLPYESGYEIHATHARRINDRDVEIYFDGDFEFGAEPKTDEYTVTLDGKTLELERRYGHRGHVHFCRMTTLRLRDALPVGDGAPSVTVTLGDTVLTAPHEDYYKYYKTSKSGVVVKGSAALLWGQKTVERACELVDIQLSACPEVAAQMVKSGATLSIFGKGECAYHIPEHRAGYHVGSLYVEGFGGIACSITECNIWHWRRDREPLPDPDYTTHYINENIMIHEFGHGVKIAGIDRMEDRSLYTEFQMLYRHARAAGLWPNTYAISNSDEYFATLSAIWFNVMNECNADDGWDGTRGPINTRRELYNYDIDAYKFFSKIYPYRDLDGAWTPVPDRVHVTGLRDDPEEDFTGRNFTLNYPEPDAHNDEISLGEGYVMLLPHGGFHVDAAGADGHACVVESEEKMLTAKDSETFVFEAVEGEDVKTVVDEDGDIERVYTVYIRCAAGGYLYCDGDRITAGERKSAFTVTLYGDGGFCLVECGGARLVLAGRPNTGTPLTVTTDETRRGGYWRLCRLSAMKKRAVFVHDGEANGCSRGIFADVGSTVTLSAMPECGGKRFAGWRISHGEIADASACETCFVMPHDDTVVWTKYE